MNMLNIYFFIGTKAQAIKCLPLINYFIQQDNEKIYLVNSGQHILITNQIFKEINKDVDEINLFSNNENISKYFKGIMWTINFIFKFLIFRTINGSEYNSKNICVVHGDTISTLLGLFWAKRNKLKVLHLESGLTSNSITNPFPEEIIRRITARFSDILISFDEESYLRLKNKFYKKYVFKASENTIYETLRINENKNNSEENILTATLHRTENIFSKNRIKLFVNLLIKLAENYEVNWYVHEPTKNAIKNHNLYIPKSINLLNLVEHDQFIKELKKSKIVITDGGSVQEECFYLGITTIVWRNTTERPYAMNKNMFISNYDIESSYNFCINQSNIDISNINLKLNPSEEIYNFLVKNKLLSN